MNKLKAVVIGAGVMGQNHLRAYREMSNVELVGFVDPAADLATVSHRFGVPGWRDLDAMLDAVQPDIATVAVPTALHSETALYLMEHRVHVLIEKPIAQHDDEAIALIDAADRANLVLAIGHIERHNPAIAALKERIDAGVLGRLFEIRADRVGPFPARINDVGVILDLATHDLDVMCYLAGGAPTRVFAETQQHLHSSREDMVTALVRFPTGVTGTLHVNWLSPAKTRRVRVTGEGGMIEVDYITQDLTFFENGDSETDGYGSLQLLRGVSEGRVIREKILKREPLRLELEDFVNAVLTGKPPRVTGRDGLLAVRVARALVESGERNTVVAFQP